MSPTNLSSTPTLSRLERMKVSLHFQHVAPSSAKISQLAMLGRHFIQDFVGKKVSAHVLQVRNSLSEVEQLGIMASVVQVRLSVDNFLLEHLAQRSLDFIYPAVHVLHLVSVSVVSDYSTQLSNYVMMH